MPMHVAETCSSFQGSPTDEEANHVRDVRALVPEQIRDRFGVLHRSPREPPTTGRGDLPSSITADNTFLGPPCDYCEVHGHICAPTPPSPCLRCKNFKRKCSYSIHHYAKRAEGSQFPLMQGLSINLVDACIKHFIECSMQDIPVVSPLLIRNMREEMMKSSTASSFIHTLCAYVLSMVSEIDRNLPKTLVDGILNLPVYLISTTAPEEDSSTIAAGVAILMFRAAIHKHSHKTDQTLLNVEAAVGEIKVACLKLDNCQTGNKFDELIPWALWMKFMGPQENAAAGPSAS